MKPHLLWLLLLCFATPHIEAQHTDRMAQARQWCDTTSLHALEGIWLLPDDHIYLLVRRTTPTETDVCSLHVLLSLDGITQPGTQLGVMYPAADRKTVRLQLPTRSRNHKPTAMRNCNLTVADNGYALIIQPQPKSFRFSLSPISLLPGFWRLVRLSYSPQITQPVQGLLKVYPTYDSNGSDRHNPRVL